MYKIMCNADLLAEHPTKVEALAAYKRVLKYGHLQPGETLQLINPKGEVSKEEKVA